MDKVKLKENPDTEFVQDLWFKEDEVYSHIYNPEETVQTSIRLEFLDLPGIYHYSDEDFIEMMNVLANTQNFSYFAIEAI